MSTQAFLAISNRFQKKVHSIVTSPEIFPLRHGCRQVLLDTNFHFSLKPSMTPSIFRSTSTCEVGTPAFLAISSRFQTQVHSIVASPEIYPLIPGCRQVPLGTSLNFSNKPSITSSICRRTSTCKVGTPAFLAISNRFQKKIHCIVASPEIYPLSPGCRQVFLRSSFHSSHKPSITSSICRSTSTCELGTPRLSGHF